MNKEKKNYYENLPETPGVYLMKDGHGSLLYVGKAANLKRRVSSYFLRPQEARISRLVSEIRDIEVRKTDTALEALILEAGLIKKLQPPYNIKDKDNKTFLYLEIGREDFPVVRVVRGSDIERGKRYGPFISGHSLREALKVLRRIFPYSTHEKKGLTQRPCLNYEIGLCSGVCAGLISKRNYRLIIHQLERFFRGKKREVAEDLRRNMENASKENKFEEAKSFRDRLFALQHIRDTAFVLRDEVWDMNADKEFRIEGYDISNISGTSAVGSMVVFIGDSPKSAEYRKFRIRSVTGSNDVAMLEEVLRRRFRNNWNTPQLILIDGGMSQFRVAVKVLKSLMLEIPVVSIAKGPERKRNDIYGTVPSWTNQIILEKVRDEAHRFALSYHKTVRARTSLKS